MWRVIFHKNQAQLKLKTQKDFFLYVQSLSRNGANEKIRQNAENKQTFGLTGKIEFEGKSRQTLKLYMSLLTKRVKNSNREDDFGRRGDQ